MDIQNISQIVYCKSPQILEFFRFIVGCPTKTIPRQIHEKDEI